MPAQHATNGRFLRSRKVWDEGNWDDGYFDNRGRFRVYRPDCPRAFADGYVLRAHVVWWLRAGTVHPDGTNLHHLNGDKSDDRFENLAVLEHGAHARLHNTKPPLEKVCPICGKIFGNRKKPHARFCSQECYHLQPKSTETRRRLSEGIHRAYVEGRR